MRAIETCCHSALSQPRLDRRGLLGFLGGGAALLGAGFRPGLALAAGGTDALLLNCIDYRLTGEGFDDGYQSVPVNWGISSPRKKAFFERLKEVTGQPE